MSSAHPPRVQLASVAWDDPDLQRLALAQQAELRARYDGASEPGVPPSAADLSLVLLARDDSGAVLACGALRQLGPDTAELKRMYVVPAARGRGVSKAVLAALEAARERGGRRCAWRPARVSRRPSASTPARATGRSARSASTPGTRRHRLAVLRARAGLKDERQACARRPGGRARRLLCRRGEDR